MRSFVAPTQFAHQLVSCSQGGDGDEREEEGQRRVDVPLAEDDAEVGRVPCEEHLYGGMMRVSCAGSRQSEDRCRRRTNVHVAHWSVGGHVHAAVAHVVVVVHVWRMLYMVDDREMLEGVRHETW